ncbi:MAG: CARDB domain-containing protein [Candidatus Bipolaricaulia bacterium]
MTRKMGLFLLFLTLGLGLTPLMVMVGAEEALPDLVVKAIRFSPGEPEPGEAVQINATIANVGDGDASRAFSVRFKVDEQVISRQRVRQLRAGRTVELQAEWEAVEGEHRIIVEADLPEDAVQEANERNNTLQVGLTVRRRAAISSLTDEITLTIGRSLRVTGEGLSFAIGSDLSTALAEGLKLLEEAKLTLSQAGSKLLGVTESLPSPLAGEPIARGGRAVGQLFLEMAASLGKLAPALQGLNLEAGLAALREIEAELIALSRLEFDRVRLGPLALAAQHLEEAVEAALALWASLSSGSSSSSSGQSLGELLAPLQAALEKAKEVVVALGAQIEGLSLNRGIIFSDATTGQLPRTYHPGEPLSIQVYGAVWLAFEVYSTEGKLISRRVVVDESLQWRGEDNQGRTLPAGQYFYRLLMDRGAPSGVGEEKDLGRLVITGPDEARA